VGDEVYGPERAERLLALLRGLAARILELDDRAMLAAAPELQRLIGDIRSELFHYEVRRTYDTPEVAEHRRIVEDAQRGTEALDFDDEGEEPWQGNR
jgi:hypothetical protein